MSTYTYCEDVKPERVRVSAHNGEINISVMDENYRQTFICLKGDDIVGIARALQNVIVIPEKNLAKV
jgi:hypothetical protein